MKYSVFIYGNEYIDYSIINKDRGFRISDGMADEDIINEVCYEIYRGKDVIIHYLRIHYKIRYSDISSEFSFKYLFKLVKNFRYHVIYDAYRSYELHNFKFYVIEINKKGYV